MSTSVHCQALLDRTPTAHFSESGRCQCEFMAFLPREVYERKMINAIVESTAKVISANESLVRLRIGRKKWLHRYTADDLPLKLSMRICRETVCSNSMTHVVLDIQPRARVRREILEKRCYRLIRTLRSCMAGEDLVKMDLHVA